MSLASYHFQNFKSAYAFNSTEVLVLKISLTPAYVFRKVIWWCWTLFTRQRTWFQSNYAILFASILTESKVSKSLQHHISISPLLIQENCQLSYSLSCSKRSLLAIQAYSSWRDPVHHHSNRTLPSSHPRFSSLHPAP